ncbi:phosphoenolpyruvate hydrolase family protein [Sporomusa acidovorans]|uniref:HTH-type transcriptional activator RhaR n=1 Tax=Sporomusa acidovorans (strain ATCC 49682 / DSM 3132 / Mol) TaxID=1123286 RepID=A0ABZ3IVT8_SPOA4|nr:phosphoenolpyruvate hydrolase family protein [Sporomusa acidovorans]OZC24043.1 HTH-type transcriptional activator Btr [Sporomusa acidovorans DSM 3132]SDF58090.1 Predicted TIM-barrel enzyme [Sporomusa acidovorans]
MAWQREQVLKKLKNQIRITGHIIGVAVGAGITAKYALKAGADLLLALNSGRFRQMGQSSLAGWLPFANCNEMVIDFGTREIIPVAKEIPVIFGLNATDPTIELDEYIDLISAQGFSGINNFPTVGMIDGQFREALEEDGISFEREIEAIRIAHNKNLFTLAFVFDARQAKEMLKAGADLICAHLGLTKGGYIGAKKVLSLHSAKLIADEIFNACDEVSVDTIKMIYGGPVKTPIDLSFMYNNTKTMGYIGGSSFERIPSEDAITNITKAFKKTGYIEQDELLVKMIEGVKNHYDYVDFIKEYVSVNYMNEVLFSDLANVAHISRSHLSALFKKEVGCTFPEYLVQFRISKAKEIMKFNNIRLNEVANMVGFKDYAHFSKTFKRLTGISPEKYQIRFK